MVRPGKGIEGEILIRDIRRNGCWRNWIREVWVAREGFIIMWNGRNVGIVGKSLRAKNNTSEVVEDRAVDFVVVRFRDVPQPRS